MHLKLHFDVTFHTRTEGELSLEYLILSVLDGSSERRAVRFIISDLTLSQAKISLTVGDLLAW